MSVARTLRTARHIPLRQLAARARFLWLRKRYSLDPAMPFRNVAIDAAGMAAGPIPRLPDDVLWPEGLDAVERRAAHFARGHFVYLNREADFAGGIRWRDETFSPLWRYQLQYLGSVADLARTARVADAARVLTAWRQEYEGRWDAEAWHPYPASLRLVNLCVAASCAGGFEALGSGTEALAAAHAAYLVRHVEHDVRGNHILENARALAWAGRVFRGGVAGECWRTACAILEAEVPEQVLPDGGHFEMSPMYHGIVLRDFLELRELAASHDPVLGKALGGTIAKMGTFLAGVLCPDGDIPLLGDSVRNFGPPPNTLLRLAEIAPSAWTGVRSFADTGLHVLRNDRVWAIFDAGPVCPSYLPAHGQADSLTVEVWVDGACVVGDPGVHDYSGPERAWGRSSRAHSTITLDDSDTSEVFGSFRVGKRARIRAAYVAADTVVAMASCPSMRGFGRSVKLGRPGLTLFDVGPVGAKSRLHLSPGLTTRLSEDRRTAVVSSERPLASITADCPIDTEPGRASRELGVIEPTTMLVQRIGESSSAGAREARWTIGPPPSAAR